MLRKILIFAVFAAMLAVGANETSLLRVPMMAKGPVIDGKFGGDEWRDAAETFGVLRHNSAFLTQRSAFFRIGYDRENLYFACRSELPPSPMTLVSRVKTDGGRVYLDDAVELLLMPPRGNNVYQLLVNQHGSLLGLKYPVRNGGTSFEINTPWSPKIQSASTTENGWWIMEMRIPLAELEVDSLPTGKEWRLQMVRDWKQPNQQASWNRSMVFCQPDQMGIMIMDPEAPAIHFKGLGENYRQGEFDIRFAAFNGTALAQDLQARVVVDSDASPRFVDKQEKAEPGKSVDFALKYTEVSHTIRNLQAEIKDNGGKVLLRRYFSWELPKGALWEDLRKESAQDFDFAFYPYTRTIKAKVDRSDDIAGVEFQVTDATGKPVGDKIAAPGFRAAWTLPELAEGTYKIQAGIRMKDGTVKTLFHEFLVKNFPWEHNRIGLERVIVPPFKPLKTNDREIHALMTGYAVRDGFWDRVLADGENILSSPVVLKINGTPVREKSFEYTETSPDRVQASSTLGSDGVEILSTHDYDYDGMCKITMRIKPAHPVRVESAVIEIPLRGEVAKLLHAVGNVMKHNPALDLLPEQTGLLWHTLMHPRGRIGDINFRPYIWLGGISRGLSWFAESDINMSLDPAKPAMEVYRDGDTVLLKVYLVNKPCEWDKPFELVMGFQATPVKPQPEDWRKLSSRRSTPESVGLSTLAGSSTFGSMREGDPFPAGYDYSMVRKLLPEQRASAHAEIADIDAFVQKYFSGESQDRQASLRRHLVRGRNFGKVSKYLVPYLNSRNLNSHWAEYPVYQDEWWCSDYRANSFDEYNNTPTRSYQDMMLYYERELVRNGFDGIYFDNIRDWPVSDTTTGPAYELPDGSIQPYFDIFSMRELVKRTAVMLYVEGKTFLDGRPLVLCHMTNTNIAPYMSFATMTLDLEAKYGSSDFQERFHNAWLLTSVIGTQMGCVPEVLVQNTGRETEWLTRTFLAVTLPYDLPVVMNAGGITTTFHKIWDMLRSFGYGSASVKVYPCWTEEDAPVSVADRNARVACYVKNDGSAAMLSIGEFGNSDRTVNLDLNKLGFKSCRVTNAETGELLPVENGVVKLALPRHDFRLLKIENTGR
jgi:hypothetical protein